MVSARPRRDGTPVVLQGIPEDSMVVILGQKTSANSEVQRSSALAIQEFGVSTENPASDRACPESAPRLDPLVRDAAVRILLRIRDFVDARRAAPRGSRRTARAPPRAGWRSDPATSDPPSRNAISHRPTAERTLADPQVERDPSARHSPANVDETGHPRRTCPRRSARATRWPSRDPRGPTRAAAPAEHPPPPHTTDAGSRSTSGQPTASPSPTARGSRSRRTLSAT